MTVRAGLNIALDIDLVVGNVNQTVEVTAGDVPLIDTFSSEQSVDISGELIRSLPLYRPARVVRYAAVDARHPERLDRQLRRAGVLRPRQRERESRHPGRWHGRRIVQAELAVELHLDQHRVTGRRPGEDRRQRRLVAGGDGHGDQHRDADRRRPVSRRAAFLISPRELERQERPRRLQRDLRRPISRTFRSAARSRRARRGSSRPAATSIATTASAGPSAQLTDLRKVVPDFVPFDNEARGFVYVANSTVQLNDKHKLFGVVQYDSRTAGRQRRDAGGTVRQPAVRRRRLFGCACSSAWTPAVQHPIPGVLQQQGAERQPRSQSAASARLPSVERLSSRRKRRLAAR